MIELKTEEEIAVMKEGGKRLMAVVRQLKKIVRPGVRTKEIDDEAYRLIKNEGGEPSFKKVEGYHWSTCLPINNQVVHTPPSARELQNGDILTVDIGMYFEGFHTDFADSFVVGSTDDPRIGQFLHAGEVALAKAIGKLRCGSYLGRVSAAIEKEIGGHGYFVIKQLTGHGIGRQLHEDPYVLGFLDGRLEKTPLVEPGLAVAIEVIYAMGTEEAVYEKGDSWSLTTDDHSLSACFEKTVAVGERDTLILT